MTGIYLRVSYPGQRFKVGQEVVATSGSNVIHRFPKDTIGKVIRVTDLLPSGCYVRADIDGYPMVRFVPYDCLASVNWLKKEEETMTKDQLKTGMVVKLRNGEKLMYVDNPKVGAIFLNRSCYLDLEDYDDKLTETVCNNSQWDVIEVYAPTHLPDMALDNWDDMKLKWTRPSNPFKAGDVAKNLSVKDKPYAFVKKVDGNFCLVYGLAAPGIFADQLVDYKDLKKVRIEEVDD